MKEVSKRTQRSGWERFQNVGGFSMNLQMTYDLRNAEKALPASVRKSIEKNRSVPA